MMSIALPLQLYSVFFLTGVVWFLQVVHYPLLAYLEPKKRIEFSLKGIVMTSYVVLPPLFIDLASVIYLAVTEMDMLWLGNMMILYIIVLMMFTVQLPIHRKLTMDGLPEDAVRLIRNNLLLTLLWSFRSFLLLSYITLSLSAPS